jgi:hypothetical protein
LRLASFSRRNSFYLPHKKGGVRIRRFFIFLAPSRKESAQHIL